MGFLYFFLVAGALGLMLWTLSLENVHTHNISERVPGPSAGKESPKQKKRKKKKLQKTGKVGHSHVVQDLWAAVEVAFTSVN